MGLPRPQGKRGTEVVRLKEDGWLSSSLHHYFRTFLKGSSPEHPHAPPGEAEEQTWRAPIPSPRQVAWGEGELCTSVSSSVKRG